LKALQDKMQEYIENGARLGWLIDTEARQVLVFQPQKKPVSLEKPEVLSENEVLMGFELDMQKIWNAEF
jgi:Uma2 family endonuclease